MRILDFRSLLQGSRARSVPCLVNPSPWSALFVLPIFIAVSDQSSGSSSAGGLL
jgi:hypothetical protein